MRKSFTGYKVPKTLNFRKIEVRQFLAIPKQENLDFANYYYFFKNNITWAIPQKCNKHTPKEAQEMELCLAYIKNHYGHDKPQKGFNAITELFPVIKEYLEVINEEKKQDLTKLKTSGKFIIKQQNISKTH